MIYIYDILLNLNEELYDFYDWKDSDNYKYAKKIPLFKISNYDDIVYNHIKVNSEFLDKIKNKTQVFKNKNLMFIPYACLFTNGYDVIAIEFNKNGKDIKKSRLLVNEEMEILEVVEELKTIHLGYEILGKNEFNVLTRKEKDIIKTIEKFIYESKDNKNLINYLCYEWFGEEQGDIHLLLNGIKEKFTSNHIEFLKFINILSK